MFKLLSQVVGLRELVADFILHSGNFLLSLIHLLLDSAFQAFDFFQISIYLFLLNFKPCSCGFTVFKLALFKLEVTFHFIHLFLAGQLILSGHGLLHVFQQRSNQDLVIFNLFFILNLLLLKLLGEFINLLFLLV